MASRLANAYNFSQKGCVLDKSVWEACGKRGQLAFELASLKLPVVPGFVIDSKTCINIDKIDLSSLLKTGLSEVEAVIGRKFGDEKDPLLLKIIFSPNLTLAIYPTVFNIGLNPETIEGFGKILGDIKKAWFEYCYLLRTVGTVLYDIPVEKFDKIEAATKGKEELRSQKMRELIGEDKVPYSPHKLLEIIIRLAAKRYYEPDLDESDNIAIMIQGIVFGNLSDADCVGVYHTRDIVTGDSKLNGYYQKNSYTLEKKENKIETIAPNYLKKLQEIAELLENRFHELRQIKFIVEKGKLWIISQNPEDKKSTQAHIRTLLDLLANKSVKEEWLVQQILPSQLLSLLHPVVREDSVEGIAHVSGGLTGSPGAAVGKVYFSADALMSAHHLAVQNGIDSRMILCVSSSYAEDVKAIELGQGVIAIEGGYSSHAPVVARSIGKVAIINSEIKISGKSFSLDGLTVNEGDYVTIDAPTYKSPSIYLGQGDLISPDPDKNGLIDFIKIVRKYITPEFVVRANADLGRDAKVAKKMGAFGIGLCRTEHMFFADDRIMRFREMIFSSTVEERIKCLQDLHATQRSDFQDLFETMAPYPVTIRLLDAPLHEFLPNRNESFEEYCKYLVAKGIRPDKKELRSRIEGLGEFNPMLGHRGCRVAVTYPEIYHMQVRAIIEAAINLGKKGVKVEPEIMVPLIMNPAELSMIRNGKKIEGQSIKGIVEIIDEVFKKENAKVKYKVGTMIELPAASLLSGDIARYADFFSYGTNDLTQTTNGLSRDDINSFFPDYSAYDLLGTNPFQILGEPVKELIEISSSRGRLTRPDIKLGLCGEHGADPANIKFCKDIGLQYVSCSSYSIPIAMLSIAQENLKD